jgi:hypothetical protein
VHLSIVIFNVTIIFLNFFGGVYMNMVDFFDLKIFYFKIIIDKVAKIVHSFMNSSPISPQE